jgi:surface protein
MATTYTRPSDWLTMPTVASSAQTFVGLFAVRNSDSNYVALRATGTGNYQVDWGDGTVTTHASNAQAEYLYPYSGLSDSTICSRGYKQALITVTPVTGFITGLNTNVAHSALGVTAIKQVKWLEYLINLPFLASLSIAPTGNNARANWLERVTISNLGSLTSFSGVFSSLFGLKAVNITASTTGITNTSYMFSSCISLISVNLFNTSNVLNAVQMFYGCTNLEQVPNFNLSKATTVSNMFNACNNLKTVPAFDMRLVTDFSGMFINCLNLTEIGLIDTRSGTNFATFAQTCPKLRTIANLDMSKATSVGNGFQGCTSLDNFPAITIGAANCNLGSLFLNNSTLKKVGNIDVSKATTFSNFFTGGHSLRNLPPLNLNSGTTLTTMVSPVMASAPFTNVRASLNLANKNLGRLSIIEVFNGLASGVTSRTITVSANPGFSALTAGDRLIATAKGWTIA